MDKNKRSELIIISIIFLLVITGMYFYYQTSMKALGTPAEQVQQLSIQGTGQNLQAAFDNNDATAWTGTDAAGQFNYMIIDLKKIYSINNISIGLGVWSQPIDYSISIQSSNDAANWRDIISGIETGYITEPKTVIFDKFLPQDTKYIKIGIKVVGSTQNFKVTEIKIQ